MISKDQWKVRVLSKIKIESQLSRIIPHYLNQNETKTQSQFEDDYYELEFSRNQFSWTFLRSKAKIEQFLVSLHDFSYILITFNEFLKNGITSRSKLEKIMKKKFFIDFCEITHQTFNKVKSLKMYKKSGGRFSQFCTCQISWLKWKIRDFVITKDGVLYCDSENKVQDFLPFGPSFSFQINPQGTEEFKIKLKSNHRILSVRAENFIGFFSFLFYLDKALSKSKQEIARFESFAPIREKNEVEFLIDGMNYFHKMAAMLEQAQQQVFISGWWVSPEFHLIRPCEGSNLKYRLDTLISSLAKKGVKIYIIVYWQSSFLSNESLHTEKVFSKMGPNVKIIRHPDIVLPSFWSHHEKIVIIDQKIAFLGGLDVCYGRYDTQEHSLEHNSSKLYPGIQFNNIRKKDFSKVKNISVSPLDRTQPRLPWHDVAVMIGGSCVKDIVHHFVEYWNFASLELNKMKRSVLISDSSRNSLSKNQRIKSFFSKNWKKFHAIFRRDQENEMQDRSQKMKEGSGTNLNKGRMQFEEESDKNGIIHFSLHDVEGDLKKTSKFQEQIEEELRKKIKERQSKEKQRNQKASLKIQVEFEEEDEDDHNENFINEKVEFSDIQTDIIGGYRCQILRSACQWSIGCKQTNVEKSIHTAYLHLIKNAERFIYIQNQFFISAVKEDDVVENRIGDALVERIQRAIEKDQEFNVMILMPLLPGFPGEIDQSDANVPRAIMHWEYRVISRHKNSILNRIKRMTDQPQKYINFLSLRAHGIIEGTPKTEIIYIHSKLMIIDDKKAIIGSANINDRSMNGDRDSQIDILIEGKQNKEIILSNGYNRLVSHSIFSLRAKLWKEHFNLNMDEIYDPNDQKILKRILKDAKRHTEIYRNVFGCYPDDNIRKLKDLFSLRKEPNLEFYKEQIKNIKSNIVEFPYEFLSAEKLTNFHPDAIST